MRQFTLGIFVLVLTLCACDKEQDHEVKQFSLLDPEDSQLVFENLLGFDPEFNIYTYRNFYNGGGVGIGDVNNDGWMDIYLTANMSSNKLFLNNGDLTFRDITLDAGVSGNAKWSTGVSMADVNGDGWLDIYVCNSGDVKGDNKQNELFINQGDGSFKDEAEAYGLADQGYSTHAAFFDFDRDGDLDVYLLNNSFQAIGSFNLRRNERPVRNSEGGDKMFENRGGRFVDISEEAGIYGSVIGFGLGVTVGDIDQDGWQDLYISNDFFERDYIYMNNGDGTFTENLERQMKSISGASMGADMADINNDGYPEIFVTEMLPEPNERLKTKTTFENWDRYQYSLDNGYYHQFTRNMFHLNNGDDTFSEIGRMLGVEATDWSWGALISDFDNDGKKDLFIANGIYKDLTDQDYINYISTEEMANAVISKQGVDFKTLTDVIPSVKIPNYMFRNVGSFKFENVTDEWGLSTPSHSNGSAYVDLDNDGDLDLVINNVNEEASVYINNNETIHPENGFLKVELKGDGKNTLALGTKLIAYIGNERLHYEQMPVRGFQSSVDPRPNFGIRDRKKIDSLIVNWPNGTKSKIVDLSPDQTLKISLDSIEKSPGQPEGLVKQDNFIFHDISESSEAKFTHVENQFVDFDRDRLLYHMLSVEGPSLCNGDFNGDGLEDFYIGGAKDQSGKLFLQRKNGSFELGQNSIFGEDEESEDVDCACFDADQDGDIDLYVASGGNEFSNNSSALIDRLYLNNGKGSFSKSDQILPSFRFENSSTIQPCDYDQDGDVDLFVGIRAKPLLIGVPTDSYLLENDGTGHFTDRTTEVVPELKEIGMVTDAEWADVDSDGDKDLVVIGEWMQIRIFLNNKETLDEDTSLTGLDSTHGWWNQIESGDIDNDGDIDLVLGNHGLNSRFKASRTRPVEMYVNDYDRNGSVEAIICRYFGDKSYPLCLKHDLIAQLPALKKKYVKYESFMDQGMADIFPEDLIENAVKSKIYLLESIILLNNDNKGFEIIPLPAQAQLSPIYAISIEDFDKDGNQDLLLGGNFYNAKPEVGRYDASFGVFLKGDGEGNFEYLSNKMTGLRIEDQIREFRLIKDGAKGRRLLVGRNNADLKIYSY